MRWQDLFHRGRASSKRPARPLGFVLGGGAVRGAAHLGVLAVLEREGVKPDIVTGTSIGAVIGAGVAAGVSAADMLEQFRAARWTSIARPSWGSKLAMLDTNPLGELLTRITSAQAIEDLGLPFAAVACDILTGTEVVITQGPLAEAVIASSAIPALFEPVASDGRLLVDGGLTDNLPVDAARSLGAAYVIAVDIMPPLDGTYRPKDVRDTLLMTWNIVQRAGETGRADADLVITPDVVRVPLADFTQVDAAYDAGVSAAEAALPELLADLAG
jgi:NTE family protein